MSGHLLVAPRDLIKAYHPVLKGREHRNNQGEHLCRRL